MQEGLEKTDKDNEELRSGLQNCFMTINKVVPRLICSKHDAAIANSYMWLLV